MGKTRKGFVALVLLIVLLAAAAIAPLYSNVGTAWATCSIGATDYAQAALREVANTPILLVGTVTSERSIPRPPNT